jgi:putative ABC transport system permease protein
MYLVLRTRSEPSALVAAVRGAVWSIDGDQPVYDIATMEERVDSALGPARFNSMLLSVFALVSLMLAAVGVYGVVSYSVTQRNHEIGIRMAIGANGSDVRAMILRQNLVTVGAGLVLGLTVAVILTRLIAGLLYDVSTHDPVTYVSVAVVLLSAAVIACYVPALRATRVDPVAVLRQE